MKLGIQSMENLLFLNMLFRIDGLDPKFGPTIEVFNDFMKFGTKNKWNILTDTHCLDSGQNSFWNWNMLSCYS